MRKVLLFATTAMVLLLVSCHMEIDTPVASVASGTYPTAQTITLSCSNENLRIFYTLNGSSPTNGNGIEYTGGSFSVDYTTCVPRTVLKIACRNAIGRYSPVVEYQYVIMGPGGGYVFYDKGSYSDGWRYLEAAPEDIAIGADKYFCFGFYRKTASGSNLYVNDSSYVVGTSDANDGKSTGTAVGTGKANTAKLVSKMGSAAYIGETGSGTTANYAAKLCDDYENNDCGDWFLPSKDELRLLYANLYSKDIGGFLPNGFYWSSSENGAADGVTKAWDLCFSNSFNYLPYRSNTYRVRAVRAF